MSKEDRSYRPKSKSFTFNGKTSEEMGLVIQTPPSYSFPERDIETVSIPGRNGDIHLDNKRYKNVTRTYNVTKKLRKNKNNELATYSADAETILNWLTSGNKNYVKLEDEYDQDIYRMARFNSNGEFINYFNKADGLVISFDCKPQRFLKEYDHVIESGNEIIIDNIFEDKSYTLSENEFRNYGALPIISINNIPSESNHELLLEVKNSINNINKVTSIITINDSNINNIKIDSEEKIIIDDNDKNLMPYCSLNGLPFPVFDKGRTILSLKKYEKQSWQFKTYNSLINDNKQTVKARHESVENRSTARQKTFEIMSYDSLRELKSEKYTAKSVRAFIEENCEKYTMPSFSNILSAIGCRWQFVGSLSEENKYADGTDEKFIDMGFDNSGKCIIQASQKIGEDIIKYYVANDVSNAGAWILHNNIPRITHYNNRDLILEIAQNETLDIYYYPCKLKDSDDYDLDLDIKSIFGNPDWLLIKTETINFNGTKALNAIKYYGNESGYYYFENQNGLASIPIVGLLFGSGNSTWVFKEQNSSNPNSNLLDTLTWNTNRKSFKGPSAGLFSSEQKALNYGYFKATKNNDHVIIDNYGPLEEIYIDDDGNKRTRVVAQCRFDVHDVSGNKDLSDILLYKKSGQGYIGWYKVLFDGLKNQDSIKFKRYGSYSTEQIYPDVYSQDYIRITGTTPFIIQYLKEPPIYDNLDEKIYKDWPEFISRKPAGYDDTTMYNDIYLEFDQKYIDSEFKDYYYRIQNDNSEYSEWKKLKEEQIGQDKYRYVIDYKLDQNKSYKACYIKEVPKQMKYDRVYYNTNGSEADVESDVPLDWLGVELNTETIPVDSIDNMIAGNCYHFEKYEIPLTPPSREGEIDGYYIKFNDIYNIISQIDPGWEIGYINNWVQDIELDHCFEYNFNEDATAGISRMSIQTINNDYGPIYYKNFIGEFDFVYLENNFPFDFKENFKQYITEYKLKTITFKAYADGWYLFDSNTVWKYYIAGDTILTTTGPNDEHDFYYLQHMPEYDDDELIPWQDIFEIVNPSKEIKDETYSEIINYKVKQEGYFRTNTNVDWKYYYKGDTIIESRLMETNMVMHLNPDEEISANWDIDPRWWML